MSRFVCVDFGSTFTKAIVVDAGSGDLVARAEHRTTIDTDVMDGWFACREQLLAADRAVARAELLGCSEGTVKSNSARGLNALRQVMDEPREAGKP